MISALTTNFHQEEISSMRQFSAGNQAVNIVYLATYNPSKPDSHIHPKFDSDMELRKSWIYHKYMKKAWYRKSHLFTKTVGNSFSLITKKLCTVKLHVTGNQCDFKSWEQDLEPKSYCRDQMKNNRQIQKNFIDKNKNDVDKDLKESNVLKLHLMNDTSKNNTKISQNCNAVQRLMQNPNNSVCVDCTAKVCLPFRTLKLSNKN